MKNEMKNEILKYEMENKRDILFKCYANNNNNIQMYEN
jgi:hypothetical protein